MTEQEFAERWQTLTTAETSELQRQLAEARARLEERLAVAAEKITDKIRDAHARPKALLIHEALTPDAHGRYLKQETLAGLTGMSQQALSEHAAFGHWQVYTAGGGIKSTLHEPTFFDRLGLKAFLRLLSQTESQAGPRSQEKVRREDYERRFREMVDRVNAGAGKRLGKEEIYPLLESLAGKKKPVPVTSLVQHLEQQYPDRDVRPADVNVWLGAFKKKGEFLTEIVESTAGEAVRIRKTQRVDPGKALASLDDVLPLLEEVLELSGRTTARTSLVQISANVQRVIRALKELKTWAECEPRQ